MTTTQHYPETDVKEYDEHRVRYKLIELLQLVNYLSSAKFVSNCPLTTLRPIDTCATILQSINNNSTNGRGLYIEYT